MLQDEQDKIHNLQHQEINKLKSMLMFREEARDKNQIEQTIEVFVIVCLLFQEAVATSQKNKAIELQIENLKNEITRIQKFESNYEDLKVLKNQNVSMLSHFVVYHAFFHAIFSFF